MLNKYSKLLLNILFILSVISCEKINETINNEQVENDLLKYEIEIKNSIIWLNKNSLSTKAYSKWVPLWENAQIFQNDTSKTIEIPLSYLAQKIVSIDLSLTNTKNKNDILSIVNKESLVIEANKDSIYRAFFMVIVPSNKYIQSNGKSLTNMTYLYRDNKFDGLVLFKNLSGKFVSGWKYKDGKIIERLKFSNNKAITKSSVTYCQTTYEITWIEWTYSNSYTIDVSNIEISEDTNCWTVDDPYYGGGGGSGSEGGGYIDSNDNASTDDKIKLDAASLVYKSVIDNLYQNCAGREIVENITNYIYINNNPNQTHSLDYKYSTLILNAPGHIISWKNDMPNIQSLIHELVHILQKEAGLSPGSSVNAEIEAFMAYYLFTNQQGLMLIGDIDWLLFDGYIQSPTTTNYNLLVNAVKNYDNQKYINFLENTSMRNFDRIISVFSSCYSINIQNPQ